MVIFTSILAVGPSSTDILEIMLGWIGLWEDKKEEREGVTQGDFSVCRRLPSTVLGPLQPH